ncbi:DUF6339 family protein [Acinetobacter faecalis]|uniref:DUF6339 family protein n=1 Tax=Acinetobacter faecalis TaxID=2665161 RepID=A0ABU5GKP9_9GAMM|nr:DUF6339 family protein [Acinetobacter faecalis]MDY6511467.1 DUF6339 family protein [Acinetobacter faecalis]MDY6551116.1 DUF6339 family protein [Acinetobacter faecalis]
MAKLKVFSDQTMEKLKSDIKINQQRYVEGDFIYLLSEDESNHTLDVEVDYQKLKNLEFSDKAKSGESDVVNSLIIGEALEELIPAMASEPGIWTRLSHVECLEYSRKRWLSGINESKLDDAIKTHFFADSQTKRRDDSAISRLWWNYHIAQKCMPNDIETALRLFVTKTDIRSNFVERIWLSSRISIASAVLRVLRDEEWLSQRDLHFREFMKLLNRLGAGKVFETYTEAEIDLFVLKCVDSAKEQVQLLKK